MTLSKSVLKSEINKTLKKINQMKSMQTIKKYIQHAYLSKK